MNINTLPADVFSVMFSNLHGKSLFATGTVCRQWRQYLISYVKQRAASEMDGLAAFLSTHMPLRPRGLCESLREERARLMQASTLPDVCVIAAETRKKSIESLKFVHILDLRDLEGKCDKSAPYSKVVVLARIYSHVMTVHSMPTCTNSVHHKNWQFAQLSNELAQLGEIKEAISVAKSISNDHEMNFTLSQVARCALNADDTAQAIDIAKTITSSDSTSVFHDIFAKLIEQDQIPKALEVARSLPESESMISHLSWKLVKKDAKLAIDIAETLDDKKREYTLDQIVITLTQQGNISHAVEAANKIKNPITRAVSIYNIASTLEHDGDHKGAVDVAGTEIIDMFEILQIQQTK